MWLFWSLITVFLISIGESKPDFSLIGFGASTTGGNNKNIITVTSVEELKKHAESVGPVTIHINTTLSGGTSGIQIKVTNDKTILGVESNAFLEGIGFHLEKVNNIIIRNLKMTVSTVTKTIVDNRNHTVIDMNGGDIITIDGSTNIWIDHNELYNKDPAVNPNKDLYDGLIDIIRKSDNVTLSWNYFHDHYKTNLIGASDTDNFDRRVTFHHNHWRNTNERVPSYRFGHGHVFNNFYEHVVVSGIHTRMGACLVVEKNYFDDVVKALLSHADSIEDGMFELNDNFLHNTKEDQSTSNATCSYQLPYKYVLEESSVAKENVMNYAGVGKI